MAGMSPYRDRMSFEDIATMWAAELDGQPNAPTALDILSELWSAFMHGEFEDDKGSRVTRPYVEGEYVDGQEAQYVGRFEIRELGDGNLIAVSPDVPSLYCTIIDPGEFEKVVFPILRGILIDHFDGPVSLRSIAGPPTEDGEIYVAAQRPFRKTHLPAPRQEMTRAGVWGDMRHCEEWRRWPADVSFEELAGLPINKIMSSLLGAAIRLCHISFADFDALRESLGYPPPVFWKGSGPGRRSDQLIAGDHNKSQAKAGKETAPATSPREAGKAATAAMYRRWFDDARQIIEAHAKTNTAKLKPGIITHKIVWQIRRDKEHPQFAIADSLNAKTIHRTLNRHHRGWSIYPPKPS